jgi:hypothetical protein
MAATQRDRERRWVVLGEDGRYATLGRASDPSEAELREVEANLAAAGLGGWLAVMEGNPHVGPVPRLMEVRRLGVPARDFAAAAETCIANILARRPEIG